MPGSTSRGSRLGLPRHDNPYVITPQTYHHDIKFPHRKSHSQKTTQICCDVAVNCSLTIIRISSLQTVARGYFVFPHIIKLSDYTVGDRSHVFAVCCVQYGHFEFLARILSGFWPKILQNPHKKLGDFGTQDQNRNRKLPPISRKFDYEGLAWTNGCSSIWWQGSVAQKMKYFSRQQLGTWT